MIAFLRWVPAFSVKNQKFLLFFQPLHSVAPIFERLSAFLCVPLRPWREAVPAFSIENQKSKIENGVKWVQLPPCREQVVP
jgi:hypothetical protein